MQARNSMILLASLTLLAAGCAHAHHEHLTVKGAPPAVIDGFHRDFPGLAITHIDSVREADGTVQYEVKFRDALNEYHHKMFSATGQLLDSKEGVALPLNPEPPT